MFKVKDEEISKNSLKMRRKTEKMVSIGDSSKHGKANADSRTTSNNNSSSCDSIECIEPLRK